MVIYQGLVTAVLAALLLNTLNNLRLIRHPSGSHPLRHTLPLVAAEDHETPRTQNSVIRSRVIPL
jgi:hypothetical protein